MTDIQYSFKKKVMAWILSICLVVTLIPEFAFAVTGDNSDEKITPEKVTMADIVEKTENITTYDLGGGEKMSVFHGGQVRFEDKDGKLIDYDPSLETIETGETSLQDEPLQGYSYTNKAGDKKHYLPVRMSENTPVRMEYQDYAIEFSLTNESINQLSVNDKVVKKEETTIQTAYDDNAELPVNAVYGDEEDSSQVTYTSTEDSVKETLVLNEKPETNVFQYKLNLTGMFARKNVTDGGITYYDKETEEITGFIAAPWMNDATGQAYSEDITYELEEVEGVEGEYLLTMTVDENYLNDTARQYPVTIDPSNTWQGSSEVKDVYVISGSSYGGTNFYESGTKKMPSGKNSTGTHRTYIKFIDLKGITGGQSISSAKFTAYQSPDCVGSQKIGIYRITESWSISSLTYNNRPTCTTCYDTITTTSTDYAAKTWDVKTFVKNVANGSITNHGLQLYNKTSSPSFACFVGSRASSYKPKLVVTYYSVPTKATTAKITPAYVRDSTDAQFVFSGISSTGLSRVDYRTRYYNDATQTSGDIRLDYSSSRAIETGDYLPDLGEGCYQTYIRGVNKAGVAGSYATTNILHVDNTDPEIGKISVTDPDGSPHLLTWNDVTDLHLDTIEYKVDDGSYTEAGTTVSGSINIPKEEFHKGSGFYDITVKATDKAGNSTEKTIADYYANVAGPELESIGLYTQSGKKLSVSDVTSDTDPVIKFSGHTDKNSSLQQNGVTYRIKIKATAQAGAMHKEPENLVLNIDGNNFSGSFDLNAEDEECGDAPYDIEVGFIDEEGNETCGYLQYNRDTQTPEGTISVRDVAGVNDLTQLSDTVLITGNILGDESSIVNSENIATIKDSSIKMYKNNETEPAAIVYQDINISTTRPLNTRKFDNGNYVLKYVIEDYAGNTFETEKSVTISNPISAPITTASLINDNEYMIDWRWTDAVDVAKVQYKIGAEGTWSDFDTVAAKEGSGTVMLPEGDGEYTVYVRGVDTAGAAGEYSEVTCIVDQTVPQVQLTKYENGMLFGTATDDYFETWNVSIRDVDEADSAYVEILSGDEEILNGKVGFIDLSGEEYQEGNNYVLKLEAEDNNGNISVATINITRAADEDVAELIVPSFRVKRESYQAYKEENIEFGTLMDSIELRAEEITLNSSNTNWYIDGQLKSNGDTYTDDFTCNGESIYAEDRNYEILVTSKTSNNESIYSMPVVKNGDIEEIVYSGTEDATNGIEKTITFAGNAVSLCLDADAETSDGTNITYSIKIGDGEFFTIAPNETYEICQIDQQYIYADEFVLKATVNGKSASDIGTIRLKGNIVDRETFTLSSLENYRPVELSADDRINYKTYIKWHLADNSIDLPDNVYFEVYRGTEDGFVPSEENLVSTAQHKDFYYTEMNTDYSGKYYYKVRAVEVDEEGTVIKQSAFSRQVQATVIDDDEYTKRLGIKEYWSFAQMGTPNGTAYIEKSEGNLAYQQTDAEIPNEKLTVSLDRTYNSRSTVKSAFGVGWTHSFDMELMKLENQDTLILKYGDGSLYQFTREDGSSEYVSSLGQYVKIKEDTEPLTVTLPDGENTITVNKKYIVTNKDDIIDYFNDGGQLVYETEPNGNYLIFEYDQYSGLLTKVTTNRNISMEFEYNSEADGLDPLTVKKVKLPDGSFFTYEYEGRAAKEDIRLVSVTHVGNNGNEITYEYGYDNADTPNLFEIYDAKGNKYTVEYDKKTDQAIRINDPEEKSIELSFADNGTETVTKTIIDEGILSSEKVIAEEIDTFDGWFGNCLKNIDPAGNTTTYTYKNNLLSMTETTTEYQTIDENGHVNNFETLVSSITQYNSDDDIALEKEEGLSESEYGYNNGNVVSEVTINGEGETVSDIFYEYDENNNMTYYNDAVTGEEEIIDYYEEGEGGIEGEIESEIYKEEEEIVSTSNYAYSYNDDGSKTETVTEVCDGITTVTETVIDVMGRETSIVVRVNGSIIDSTSYTYDGFGRLIKTVTVQGNVTTTTQTSYDENGTVISEIANDGTLTTYGHDKANRIIEKSICKGTSEKSFTTSYGYEDISVCKGEGINEDVDNAYVKTETQMGTSDVTRVWQNNLGQTVKEQSDGLITYTAYDKQGKAVTVYEAGSENDLLNGLLTVNLYDGNGNQTHTITNPEITTDGAYVVAEDSIVIEEKYDSEGNVIKSVDGEGNAISYSYDVEGQLAKVQQPGEIITRFAYKKGLDDGGSRISMTDAEGNISRTLMNANGLEEAVIDYIDQDTEGIKRTYQYDSRGNIIKEVELEGNYKVHNYDSKNRLTQTELFDASNNGTLKTTYAYNENDQVIEMKDYEMVSSDEGGEYSLYRTTLYTYDDFGRLSSFSEYDSNETVGQVPKVSYTYDDNDDIIAINYNIEGTELEGLRFIYNNNGWLTEIKAEDGAVDKTIREYTYDDFGRVTSIEDKYGLNSGNGSILREYVYDAFGRVSSMVYMDTADNDAVKESYTYTYDKNDNITSERIVSDYTEGEDGESDILREYTYDSLGRLTVVNETDNKTEEETVRTYKYDKVGNRLSETEGTVSTTYEYNSLNQLESSITIDDDNAVDTRSYSYDKNGNLIYEEGMGNLYIDYTYDAADRLTSVSKERAMAQFAYESYKYNGNGQRIEKYSLDEEESYSEETSKYYYQGGQVLYTEDETAAFTSMNVLGLDDNLIATSRQDTGSEKWYLYNKDIRESTSSIVSDTGDVVKAYLYDEFGNTQVRIGESFDNEICYTGQIYDEVTGLYYYNARYYNPEDGRFITQDTYRGESNDPLTYHLYAYCANNPINYVDPSGHFAFVLPVAFTSLSTSGLLSFIGGALGSVALGAGVGLTAKQFKNVWNDIDLNTNTVKKMLSSIKTSVKKGNKKGRSKKTAKHHIVAKKAPAAKPARDIINSHKIGINSERNLVKLKKHFHQYLHTNKYYYGVNEIVKASQRYANSINKRYPKKVKNLNTLKKETAKGALKGLKVLLQGANSFAK